MKYFKKFKARTSFFTKKNSIITAVLVGCALLFLSAIIIVIVKTNGANSPNTVTVHFYDETGVTLLESQTVEKGSSVTYKGDRPIKLSTERFSYEFTTWVTSPHGENEQNLTNVVENINAFAKFETNIRYYTVKFYNYNGTVLLDTQTTSYNGNVSTEVIPTKDSTLTTNYTFTNWVTEVGGTVASSLTNIKEDKIVYPKFSESARTYTLTLYKPNPVNGLMTSYEYSFEYGEMVSTTLFPSTNESSEGYEIRFLGWSRSESAQDILTDNYIRIDSNIELTALYAVTRVTTAFNIYYYNYDGSELLCTDSATYAPALNLYYSERLFSEAEWASFEREPTNEKTYEFRSWSLSKDELIVPDYRSFKTTTKLYAYYTESDRVYTVKFYDETGMTLLDTKTALYQGSVTYGGEAQQKETTNGVSYTFDGWITTKDGTTKANLSTITSDISVYATFKSNVIYYTVSFYNEDGTELLDTKSTTYGGTVTYTKETPQKESTQFSTYIFSKWTTEKNNNITADLSNVVQNMSVYAMFDSSVRYYAVKFYNGSKLLETKTTIYKGSVAYSGSTPRKDSTTQYNYTFAGWVTANDGTTIANLNSIESDCSVYASFTSTLRTYNVTFMNYDGTTLDTVTVNYGEKAEYSKATPLKPDTEEFSYTFDNKWGDNYGNDYTSSLDNVTENLYVYALYKATAKVSGTPILLTYQYADPKSRTYTITQDDITILEFDSRCDINSWDLLIDLTKSTVITLDASNGDVSVVIYDGEDAIQCGDFFKKTVFTIPANTTFDKIEIVDCN